MNLTPKQLVGRHVLTHDGELATVVSATLAAEQGVVVKDARGHRRTLRADQLRLIPVLEFRLCGEYPPGTPEWYAERGVQRRKVTIVALTKRDQDTGEPTAEWYAFVDGGVRWAGDSASAAVRALRQNDPYFRDLDVIEYTLEDGSKHTWRNS